MAFGIDEIEMGNTYIDQCLKEWAMGVDENDIYDLSDMFCFQSKGSFNMSVQMQKGTITGLDTLHRTGNCPLVEQNGRMNIIADLGTGYLCLNFYIRLRLGYLDLSIPISLQVDYIRILMKFSADSETGKDGILHDLKIVDMKGVNIEIGNGRIVNWMIGLLSKTVAFTKYEVKVLQYQLGQYLNERIQDFRFCSKRSAICYLYGVLEPSSPKIAFIDLKTNAIAYKMKGLNRTKLIKQNQVFYNKLINI